MIEVLVMGVGLTLDQATFDALRRAVEKETKVLVQTSTMIRNGVLIDDVILTKSSGYVSGYEIREQRTQDGKVVVKVLAQVDQGKLEKDLLSLFAAPAHPTQIDGPLLAGMFQKVLDDRAEKERKYEEACARDRRFKADPTMGKTVPLYAKFGGADAQTGTLKVLLSASFGQFTDRAVNCWDDVDVAVILKDRWGTEVFRMTSPCGVMNLAQGVSFFELKLSPQQLSEVHTVVAVWE